MKNINIELLLKEWKGIQWYHKVYGTLLSIVSAVL